VRIAVFLVLAACAVGEGEMPKSPERDALEALDYRNIRSTGYAFTGCGDELFKTRFKAQTASGKNVAGVVCCGVWKSCTVRF